MKKSKKRALRVVIIIFTIIILIAAVLLISGAAAEPDAHIAPDYQQIDITPILSKNQLSEEDYRTLFLQTGLGKPAVDDLRKDSPDAAQAILTFQNNFFKKIDYVCERNSLISKEESVVDGNGSYVDGQNLAPLHNGYIMITKCSHVFGWRNGHAAIIIDAAQGQTLESAVLGTNSLIQGTDKWKNFPDFMIFRIKGASDELLNEIARSALQNLNNIPYDFSVGVLSPKYQEPGQITGTQCSHLVWEACKLYGYDLDSDSGMIVTPKDIANSPLLEIVQVYGVDPQDIWP